MDWVRAWGECLRVDYLPNVDIRTVKPKAKDLTTHKGIKSAIAETLKYAIKPEDMIGDESLQAVNWFSWVHKASIQTAICGKWWGVEKCP